MTEVVPPAADSSVPSTTPSTESTPSAAPAPPANGKKIPYTGKPTENPNETLVPGKMRSDREELPEGWTKEQADKAEMKEARLQKQAQTNSLSIAVAPGCQLYWPSEFEVCGAIRDKYNSLGAQFSFLLLPTSPEYTNPDLHGRRSHFQNGPIYWSAATGAHPVVNVFHQKWGEKGWEGGFLGYPKTDEVVLNGGRLQDFTGATIYWSPLTGAHPIGGAIRDKWAQTGWEGGSLGFPTTDENVLPDGQGRMNGFQRGVIYWHPAFGAHPVDGFVLGVWSGSGYEAGTYGYPISDGAERVGLAGSTEQQFQNGPISIALDANGGPDGGECDGTYPSGCIPSPYDTLMACRERLGEFDKAGSENIWIWKSDTNKYLQCGRYRDHIAVNHYSDPNDVSREDELNFRICTNLTLRSSVTTDAGDGTMYHSTNQGVQGRTIVYPYPRNWEINNSYTNTPGGNDWGGCVRDNGL